MSVYNSFSILGFLVDISTISRSDGLSRSLIGKVSPKVMPSYSAVRPNETEARLPLPLP
jgi:hypothetical protein